MDRDDVKGFRRWVDHPDTKDKELHFKRADIREDLKIIKDPDVSRQLKLMIRYIDDELQARADIKRLRETYQSPTKR